VLDVIRFQFDPTITPFGLTVRLETLALAGVVFVALVLAALGAGRMRSRFEATRTARPRTRPVSAATTSSSSPSEPCPARWSAAGSTTG